MPCMQKAAAKSTVQGCQAAMWSRLLQRVCPSRWATACAACTSLLHEIPHCRIHPRLPTLACPRRSSMHSVHLCSADLRRCSWECRRWCGARSLGTPGLLPAQSLLGLTCPSAVSRMLASCRGQCQVSARQCCSALPAVCLWEGGIRQCQKPGSSILPSKQCVCLSHRAASTTAAMLQRGVVCFQEDWVLIGVLTLMSRCRMPWLCRKATASSSCLNRLRASLSPKRPCKQTHGPPSCLVQGVAVQS